MFRVVLQYDVLKFYSQDMDTDTEAKIWVDHIDHSAYGPLLHSIEHYDMYLGKWVVI